MTSVFDLFEENLRYFPALLPVVEDEDPDAVLAAGGTPALQELRLHNGTVYRWATGPSTTSWTAARTCGSRTGSCRPARASSTSWPTQPSTTALYASCSDSERPVWSQMSFQAASDNFTSGATKGIDAPMYWPGYGDVPVTELVLRKLLPMAHDGLQRWGVDPAVRERLLGVIEGRCTSGRNGAVWQTEHVRAREAAGDSRADALRHMTQTYAQLMHSNEPVHSWPGG